MGGVVAGRGEQMKEVVGFLRTAGPTLSPFNAWLFLKGLETLRIRMQAHSASAWPWPNGWSASRASSGSTTRACRAILSMSWPGASRAASARSSAST